MIRKVKVSVADTRSVDVEDEYALDFWAKEFGVSQKKLKLAVMAAGTQAPDVRRELKK